MRILIEKNTATVFEANGGILDVEIIKNTFVAYLVLRDETNEVSYIRFPCIFRIRRKFAGHLNLINRYEQEKKKKNYRDNFSRENE